MAVYKRRYRPYHGPLTPERSRFLVLTRYAFAGLFRSRVFVLLFVLALVPTLFFAAYIFLANNSAVQQFLQFHVAGGFAVENKFFFTLTMIQTQLAFLLNCWVCPTLVAGDLVNGALPLFLSRPFSRPEYVLGKCAVIALLLSVVTWVPGLILFSLQAGLAEGGWTWSHMWMVVPIVCCSAVWILMLSLISLAVSAWVRLRIVATGVIFCAFLVPAGLGAIFNTILDTYWGSLLNFSELFRLILVKGFRLESELVGRTGLPQVPLFAAWIMMILVCVLSLYILDARLQAREVVRG
jgi:ABC-2 type transport system permease protein